jgi:hypothetical protein
MNAAARIANDDVFCEADAVMDRIKKQLLSTTSMTLSDATQLVEREGNEVLRRLLQGYLQRCSDAEVPVTRASAGRRGGGRSWRAGSPSGSSVSSRWRAIRRSRPRMISGPIATGCAAR